MANFLEECLFLGIGIGITDSGDLFAGDAVSDKLGDDLVIGRVSPGVGCTPMSQKIICVPRVAAVRCQMVDTFSPGVDLRFGEIGCRSRQHPGVGGELASVGGDGQGVINRAGPPFATGAARSAATSSCWRACCSSDIGQATTMGLPVSRRGRGRSSISAVCTSANARNICWSSGRLVKRAKRLRGRSVLRRARFPWCR